MLQIIAKLRTDNRNLEEVNDRLLAKIESLDNKVTRFKDQDQLEQSEIAGVKAALSKAEQVIRKQQAQIAN